ncbi:hypothetical protein JTE90_018893 [Oedothorax gibbosus]|uniref:Uncharacterized protein n=1 Tax=Oedothorax gibbosus TaxID=931172 RepID=A0AAV6UDZ8_9ARAC|nr:hypothetical protein JTE90_018893 [Oedothorax gibbosus]
MSLTSFHAFLDSDDWRIDSVENFLDSTINEKIDGKTPLARVLQNQKCSLEIVKFLLDHGANVCYRNDDVDTPVLCIALRHSRNEAIIEALLQKAENLDNEIYGMYMCTALRHGASKGVIKLLLNADCYACEYHDSALQCAAQFPYVSMAEGVLELLLDNGELLSFGFSRLPICYAFKAGCGTQDLKLLIRNGIDLNMCEEHNSPWFCATCCSLPFTSDIVKLIHEAGFSMDVLDDTGLSPLQCALLNCNYTTGAIKLMIKELGIQALTSSNGSLLHLAVASDYCKLEIVKLLVDAGLRVNQLDDNGEIPLHRAVMSQSSDLFTILKYLLEQGSLVDLKNIGGFTPLRKLLFKCFDCRVIKLLLEAGHIAEFIAQVYPVSSELTYLGKMGDKSPTSATPCLEAAVRSPVPSTSKTVNTEARIQRNVAEKQRRDKLNGYISELANIVPMVSLSSKRLDKTSILRLSAAHLRICKSSLGMNRKQKKGLKWCPNFLNEDQVRDILESVDGFLLVATSTAKILFTSRSVERYLGHQDIDMIGHSLFTFIHPDDLDAVKVEVEKGFLAAKEKDSGPQRCSFRCRLREKGQPRSEVVTYQYVHVNGAITSCEEENNGNLPKTVVSCMLKAFVKVVDISPYNQLSLEEATADEYITRHSLDGTIIFADHRLATITGHMPHEVVGLSAYAYIHSEDTAVALFAHHLMFSNDKGTGMIVYRLRTRNDKFVYLKSVGCLQFDAATRQVDHFVCVNQQLSDSDGDLQLKYFVDRFIPHIRGSSTTTLFESVKALQTSSTKPGPQAAEKSGASHALKNNLGLPKAEPTINGSGASKHHRSKLSSNTAKEPNVESIKRENQHEIAESMSKASFASRQENSLDIKSASVTSAIDQSGADSDGSKMQNSGTNASYTISPRDAEYFSKTIQRTNSKDLETIYVSSLDSTISIYKNSTNSSLKNKHQLPGKSLAHQNGTAVKVNGMDTNGTVGKSFAEGGIDPFHQSTSDFIVDPDVRLLPTQENFLMDDIETKDSAFSIDFIDAPGHNHSSLLKSDDSLNVAARYPNGSVAVLRNSMWSMADCDMKDSQEMCLNPVSSMDVCESLSYVESLDEPKEDLVFQDNFTLSSTLSQGDSNSQSGWNETFNFSSYPSDSTKDPHPGFS